MNINSEKLFISKEGSLELDCIRYEGYRLQRCYQHTMASSFLMRFWEFFQGPNAQILEKTSSNPNERSIRKQVKGGAWGLDVIHTSDIIYYPVIEKALKLEKHFEVKMLIPMKRDVKRAEVLLKVYGFTPAQFFKGLSEFVQWYWEQPVYFTMKGRFYITTKGYTSVVEPNALSYEVLTKLDFPVTKRVMRRIKPCMKIKNFLTFDVNRGYNPECEGWSFNTLKYNLRSPYYTSKENRQLVKSKLDSIYMWQVGGKKFIYFEDLEVRKEFLKGLVFGVFDIKEGEDKDKVFDISKYTESQTNDYLLSKERDFVKKLDNMLK